MAKIDKILLLASDYDFFCLDEDSRLADKIYQFYRSLYFRKVPAIVRISDEEELFTALKQEEYQLVLILLRHDEEEGFRLKEKISREFPQVRTGFLAYKSPKLTAIVQNHPDEDIFCWFGDGSILPAIIFYFEDLADFHQQELADTIPVILLVEDSPEFYSRYLSFFYGFLNSFYRELIAEEIDFKKKSLIVRNRLRLAHVRSLEQAVDFFHRFSNNLLGIVLDGAFYENGQIARSSGIDFLNLVRQEKKKVPVIIQSSEVNLLTPRQDELLRILDKNEQNLLEKLQELLLKFFNFGDLILEDNFANPVRIKNPVQLLQNFQYLSPDSIRKSILSGALKRFFLLRQQYKIVEELSSLTTDFSEHDVLQLLQKAMSISLRGELITYSNQPYREQSTFYRLGEGSVGGKGRGLLYLDSFLAEFSVQYDFHPLKLKVPQTLILTTEVFADYVKENRLCEKIHPDSDDPTILSICIGSSLPASIVGDLRSYLKSMHAVPLAVRSSSLLEDSLFHPFAGIYATKMIPNDQIDFELCFINLVNAIKFVFSSVFLREARSYLKNSGHRLEDEQMAVLIQPVAGRRFNGNYYPQISGVGRSFDFYPFADARPEDGVVMLALGLGKTIIDGENCLRYSPGRPGVLPQFNNLKDYQRYSQKTFYSLVMKGINSLAYDLEEQYLEKLQIEQAEKDGNLEFLASTLDWQNERLVDGTSVAGPRYITFAHILKNNIFPLNELLRALLKELARRLSAPVEIEFALSFDPASLKEIEFFLLQLRPMAGIVESRIEISDELRRKAFLYSSLTLGNGLLKNIQDVVYIKTENFNPANNGKLAGEIAQINALLEKENRHYILIGPGRWGSSDSWLGIPVKWDQISRAQVIVEVNLAGYAIDPSQGSHFFHNIIALNLAYFTVPLNAEKGYIKWEQLQRCSVVRENELLSWRRSEKEFLVMVNGKKSEGIIVIS